MRDWSRRRAILNHDLVVNRLMPRLATLVGLVDGALEGRFPPDDVAIEEVRELWGDIEGEALALGGSFLDEMSPRSLFREPPLLHCSDETKAWLVPYTHDRWVRMTAADKRQLELTLAVTAAAGAMSALLADLDRGSGAVAARPAVHAAQAAAQRLSAALASMPTRMLA